MALAPTVLKWIRQARLRHRLARAAMVRLNVGAGGTQYSGWISTDVDTLDISCSRDWKRILHGRNVDGILAEHVLEHLRFDLIQQAMKNIEYYLKPNGVFRVAVPDGFHPSEYVRELVRPGGLEPGADDHRVLLTIEDFRRWATAFAFRLVPIEYFTRDGIFVKNPMNPEYGYVSRSARNYRGRFTQQPEEMRKLLATTPVELRSQFERGAFSYTSLIVDWVRTCSADDV